ncbi:fucoxanthin chlorophyll a/c protein [Fragilariopsis cylindrus CCMP1102]|uniref:Fucoxanthin chlorophyll a/c protein n=1 Tax=Fragilariopsis cylindrus CCMP1102 TaxID=635003 RepID=A0A1E7ELA3_9STRA|nr:fucoxanthin chlorophyll a/c protein [Fragilariopsis cylindrus CCMP1102]|eukprot:OEU06688.1 fucoxanthin chlorophyll a/c protein [Fragilariopsis cylindrus CCMP1102]
MRSTSIIIATSFAHTALAFTLKGGNSNSNTMTTKIQASSVSDDVKQKQQQISDPLGLYPQDSTERQLGLIQPLESSSQSQDQTLIDPLGLYSQDTQERQSGMIEPLLSGPQAQDKTVFDPLSIYQDRSELTNDVVMSASLPFLKRPAALDGSLPGDRGFDPFNFSSDDSKLLWYREAEIKHGRLAMLASVGWVLSELTHNTFASQLDLDSLLGFSDKVPSVLNGDRREPGDFNFDPLGLGGNDYQQKFDKQEAEIFNGRLAMLGITGFAIQEFFLNDAVINQTPIFFKPFGDVVAQLMESGAANSL